MIYVFLTKKDHFSAELNEKKDHFSAVILKRTISAQFSLKSLYFLGFKLCPNR
jgi:hypothetical protein